MIDMVTET